MRPGQEVIKKESLCPNCVERLVKNKKKLGEVKNWMVCTKCGYRRREHESNFEEDRAGGALTDRLKKRNQSNVNRHYDGSKDYIGFKYIGP